MIGYGRVMQKAKKAPRSRFKLNFESCEVELRFYRFSASTLVTDFCTSLNAVL